MASFWSKTFTIKRVVIVAVIILAIIAYRWYFYYFPYSRDAYLYAKHADIRSYVSGYITEISVHNNQYVTKGDLLFQVDPRPFSYAVQKAQAKLKALSTNNQQSHQSDINRIQAELKTAQYKLAKASVRAAFDGYVTNMYLSKGDYVEAGSRLFGLIDSSHWWVIARYRETKLRRIHLGDKVTVYIDMYPHKHFHGVVDNIGWGVNRFQASNKVTPSGLMYLRKTEDWVRIAQRFAVIIRLTDLNPKFPLRVGASARTYVELGTHGKRPK